MQTVLVVVFGLMVSAPLVADPLVEGWVRQSSGEPVEDAQVLVFDWTDLQRGAVARATTDAAGRAVGAAVYFYRLRSAGQPTLTRRMVLTGKQGRRRRVLGSHRRRRQPQRSRVSMDWP